MLKRYKLLTVTHRNTSLKDLGSFVIKHDKDSELRYKLALLKEEFGLDELFYLATCNRVIFFFDHSQPFETNTILSFFKNTNSELSEDQITRNVIYKEGEDALYHMMEVASSIDSMVVGEREILRQMRDAYDQCNAWGLLGDHTRLAFKSIVKTAKAVYAQTKIGEKPVSVVSLAVKSMLQRQIARQARILLIGAGQTNNLVAKFLVKHKYQNVTVFNRSLDKAEKLAQRLNGIALPLVALEEYKRGFDCLIVCTGKTEAWISPELYEGLLNEEKNRKLVIDLAIPNNVSEGVINEFDVDYVEIDALKELADKNKAYRKQEVISARLIINKELSDFHLLHQERQIEKAMHAVPAEIKAVKNHAINQVFKKEIEGLDDETRDLMERMLSYMEKRCISIPMQAAKSELKVNQQ